MKAIVILTATAFLMSGCARFTYTPPHWKSPRMHWHKKHKHKRKPMRAPKRVAPKTASIAYDF